MPEYQEFFFNDLMGHFFRVNCSSQSHEFATKTWGLTSTLRLHLARFVILYKIAKGLPNFHFHFNDTCQIYVNLDLDYVLKYSLEVPLTYHLLKADYIVRLSRKAAVEKREEDAEDSDLINWQFNSPSLELNKVL